MVALGSSWSKVLGSEFFWVPDISRELQHLIFNHVIFRRFTSHKDMGCKNSFSFEVLLLFYKVLLFICLFIVLKGQFYELCTTQVQISAQLSHVYRKVQKHIMAMSLLLQQYCGRPLQWYCLHLSFAFKDTVMVQFGIIFNYMESHYLKL